MSKPICKKTKLGRFIAKEYVTSTNFILSVNRWYKSQILPIGNKNYITDWARGQKPRYKVELWNIVKRYIRSVHGIDADDTWYILDEPKDTEAKSNIDLFSEDEDTQDIKEIILQCRKMLQKLCENLNIN